MSSKMVPTYDFWKLSSRTTVATAWPWKPSGPPTLCKLGGFPLPYIGFVRKYDTPRPTGQSSFSALKPKKKCWVFHCQTHPTIILCWLYTILYSHDIPIVSQFCIYFIHLGAFFLNHLRILIMLYLRPSASAVEFSIWSIGFISYHH